MLTITRQEEILKILDEKKSVTVEYLSEELYVSPATIRRDLSMMEKQGLLRRSHGGAVQFVPSNEEYSFSLREQENVIEKKKIATTVLKLINNNDTIFLDSSSTVGYIIPLLTKFKYLTVTTTGLRNALLLSDTPNLKIYIPGGQILNHSNSIVGSDTIDYISRIHADITILSCSGIDEKAGFTDNTIEQAKLKQIMSKNSKKVVMLCDSTKFNKTYLCTDLMFDDVDYLITDKTPPKNILDAVKGTKCKVLTSD